MKFFTTLFIAFFAMTQLFGQALNTPKLDSLLNRLADSSKAMGSVAIAQNGRIVYRHTTGYADIDRQQKADGHTRYHIGSISKLFTATMIFQLVEEGKLGLTTPLSDFYPIIPHADKITIALLLNHHSGLYDIVNDPKNKGFITKPHSKDMFVRMMTEGKSHGMPGEKFAYSNSGYLLLGYIIEEVTHQSYNQNLQSRICARLGLKETYSPADNELKDNEAYPYHLKNGEWKRITDIYFPNVVGVGDILSTPADLIVFDEGLLHGKLIDDNSLTQMKTVTDKVFGMGMMTIPFHERAGYGHGGDTYGTHTLVVNFPADSLTLASSFNGEAMPHSAINTGLLSICFNADYKLPDFKTVAVSGDVLAQYTGKYSSKDIPLKMEVTSKGKTLFAQATDQHAFQLDAVDNSTFKYDGAGIVLEFAAGKNQMTLKQYGKAYLFTKDN